MSNNKEGIALIRRQLELINYGLEKDIWKDFSELFYGTGDTSITSFYETDGKSEVSGIEASPEHEEDSAENTKRQKIMAETEQSAQEFEDAFIKIADRNSLKTSTTHEAELSLEEKVNDAINTFEELVDAVNEGKQSVDDIISEAQRKTLKKLTQLFLITKPEKPKKVYVDQVEVDETSGIEENGNQLKLVFG